MKRSDVELDVELEAELEAADLADPGHALAVARRERAAARRALADRPTEPPDPPQLAQPDEERR